MVNRVFERLARVSLLCVFLATAARGDVTTSVLHVAINGLGCDKVREVYLVINGRDETQEWIALDPAPGRCQWTKDLGSDRTFSTAFAHFSLRVGLAGTNLVRTDCHKAAGSEKKVGNEETLVADLDFGCCNEEPIRDVTIRMTPSLAVSYLRDVAREKHKRSIRCQEVGFLRGGSGTIRSAQFGGEDVYLQFGLAKADRKSLGLLVDDLPKHEPGVPIVLTQDGIAYRLTVQRAKGKSKTTPNLSSNAIDIDIQKLGDLRVEHAEVTVR